jgi:hypothetical protein
MNAIIKATNERLVEKKIFNQKHSKRYLPKSAATQEAEAVPVLSK